MPSRLRAPRLLQVAQRCLRRPQAMRSTASAPPLKKIVGGCASPGAAHVHGAGFRAHWQRRPANGRMTPAPVLLQRRRSRRRRAKASRRRARSRRACAPSRRPASPRSWTPLGCARTPTRSRRCGRAPCVRMRPLDAGVAWGVYRAAACSAEASGVSGTRSQAHSPVRAEQPERSAAGRAPPARRCGSSNRYARWGRRRTAADNQVIACPGAAGGAGAPPRRTESCLVRPARRWRRCASRAAGCCCWSTAVRAPAG